MHIDAQVVTLIFTIVTGIGVLLQAGVLLGMFLGLRETHKKIHALTEKIEEHALPLMHNSRGLIEELSPKARVIASNLVDVTNSLKTQTEHLKTVVEDVSDRTRKQTARADSMVTGALNTLAQAGAAVERGISAPLRQVSGVLNGLRAGIDTLRVKETGTRPVAPRVPASSGVPLGTPASGVTPVSGAPPRPATAAAPTSSSAPGTPLRSVVPAADAVRPSVTASDAALQDAVNRVVSAETRAAAQSETLSGEASAAAARFVRERAASSTDRR